MLIREPSYSALTSIPDILHGLNPELLEGRGVGCWKGNDSCFPGDFRLAG